MTTIVLDSDLVMAADTQVSSNGHRYQSSVEKIFTVGGYVIGVAGRYAEALAFVDAFDEMVERQRLQQDTFIEIPTVVFDDMDNFNAIVVDPEGKVFMFEGSRFSTPSEVPVAIGSGSEYAYGALAVGADAKQAVEAAIKYDVYSGGEVRTVSHADLNSTPPQVTEDDLNRMTKKEIIEMLRQNKP